MDLPGKNKSLLCLSSGGLLAPSWISKRPGKGRQFQGWIHFPLQAGVDSAARYSQFVQVMRLPKGSVVRGKERLESLLDSLLAMEECIADQGRVRGKIDGRGPQIGRGLSQSSSDLLGFFRLHRAPVPHVPP